MKLGASPKEHTLGEIRYLTYFLEFPDGDVWNQQTHFFGPVSTWLKLTVWAKKRNVCIDLLRRGETYWKAHFPRGGYVIHRLKIENTKRERKWGVNRK